MNLNELNELSNDDAFEAFQKCCGSTRWTRQMVDARPFASRDELMETADDIWWELDRDDWLEAFGAHPRIGDIDTLREKYSSTRSWSESEQQGVDSASEQTLQRLAEANDEYFEKFRYIFIVCASGKSAAQMLDILESRLPKDPGDELEIAAGEQAKITEIRLNKLLDDQGDEMSSPITTHVLDTANGHPAEGITVVLQRRDDDGHWNEVTRGTTNDDGRISDWLPAGERPPSGVYRAVFDVQNYFEQSDGELFYSEIPIVFHLNHPDEHYHVPLLLSPYGYTTYRGS